MCPYCNPSSILINSPTMCPECRRIHALHALAETDPQAEEESRKWIEENAKLMRNQRLSEATT